MFLLQTFGGMDGTFHFLIEYVPSWAFFSPSLVLNIWRVQQRLHYWRRLHGDSLRTLRRVRYLSFVVTCPVQITQLYLTVPHSPTTNQYTGVIWSEKWSFCLAIVCVQREATAHWTSIRKCLLFPLFYSECILKTNSSSNFLFNPPLLQVSGIGARSNWTTGIGLLSVRLWITKEIAHILYTPKSSFCCNNHHIDSKK